MLVVWIARHIGPFSGCGTPYSLNVYIALQIKLRILTSPAARSVESALFFSCITLMCAFVQILLREIPQSFQMLYLFTRTVLCFFLPKSRYFIHTVKWIAYNFKPLLFHSKLCFDTRPWFQFFFYVPCNSLFRVLRSTLLKIVLPDLCDSVYSQLSIMHISSSEDTR